MQCLFTAETNTEEAARQASYDAFHDPPTTWHAVSDGDCGYLCVAALA